jgi:hypothetical protein
MHSEWLNLAGILNAPTVFLNKAELLSIFSIQDIQKLYRITQNAGFANQK